MSEQGKPSIFEQYGKRSLRDEPHARAVPGQGDAEALPGREEEEDDVLQPGVYKAAFTYKSRNRQRISVHYGNGVKVRLLSYAYLIEVVLTSHQWLTLVFSSSIVTFKGRNLDQLLSAIQDERVRALVCFRPGIHPEPASNEPCILDIQEHGQRDFTGEMGG